jgi:hypothetical protein
MATAREDKGRPTILWGEGDKNDAFDHAKVGVAINPSLSPCACVLAQGRLPLGGNPNLALFRTGWIAA